MRDVVRYNEAFKLRPVEDAANGKYRSLDEARRGNGIRGLDCEQVDKAVWAGGYIAYKPLCGLPLLDVPRRT
jgi:hypothetical protein